MRHKLSPVNARVVRRTPTDRVQTLLALAAQVFLIGACSVATRPSATAVPSRPPQATIVSLTFDDANSDNFAAAGLLTQHGLHGTFYVPSGLVGTAGHMSWDQVNSLQTQGQEIGGHTVDHVTLRGLAAPDLRHEICDDRQTLQAHGFDPVSFAYPFGSYDEAAKSMVQRCGYTNARTVRGGPEVVPPPDAFALRGFPYVVSDTDFNKLVRYVTGTRKDGGGWVILIFHHVCDNCDYFSVQPDVLDRFAGWLADQQSSGNLTVRTVGEVMQTGTH